LLSNTIISRAVVGGAQQIAKIQLVSGKNIHLQVTLFLLLSLLSAHGIGYGEGNLDSSY